MDTQLDTVANSNATAAIFLWVVQAAGGAAILHCARVQQLIVVEISEIMR
jgi:hypothetical protein